MAGQSPEEAERSFQRMIALDPTSIEGHITLGSFYWVHGRLDEAESELAMAYRLDPDARRHQSGAGDVPPGHQPAGEAEQYLRVAVDGTDTTAAHLTMADYYLSQGRDADAERVLEATAKRPDGFGEARSRLAVIRYDAGRAADRPRAARRDPGQGSVERPRTC